MVSAVKIFLDTSVLIEYVKGNNTELLDTIIATKIDCCINHIVYSEFIYNYMGLLSGRSPMSLKESKTIKAVLEETEPLEFVQGFKVLNMDEEVLFKSYEFMKKYDFLPNDALILATCKHHNLKLLGSLDSDFANACREEGIVLVDSADSLNKHYY